MLPESSTTHLSAPLLPPHLPSPSFLLSPQVLAEQYRKDMARIQGLPYSKPSMPGPRTQADDSDTSPPSAPPPPRRRPAQAIRNAWDAKTAHSAPLASGSSSVSTGGARAGAGGVGVGFLARGFSDESEGQSEISFQIQSPRNVPDSEVSSVGGSMASRDAEGRAVASGREGGTGVDVGGGGHGGKREGFLRNPFAKGK
jgi:hypothetical protein